MYIGITKKDIYVRFRDHINTTRKKKKYAIHFAILKYGESNFKIDFIEKTDDTSRESYWIDLYGTFREGYNLTNGGDGTSGYRLNDDQKAARASQTKILHESKSVGMYGKKQSEHQKRIVSGIMCGCKRKLDNHCIHCDRWFDTGNYRRWHGDNCRLNENI